MSRTMVLHVQFESWYISYWPSIKQKREITKFHVTYYMKFSRHVNFTILRKLCILIHFNFAFLSDTLFLCQSYLTIHVPKFDQTA